MKKILFIVVVITMLLSLSTCGNNSKFNENNSRKLVKDLNSEEEIPKNEVSKEGHLKNKDSSVKDTKIRLKFGDEEVIAKLYDNPTSRDLLKMLPFTITFEDYAGVEKIGYPPKVLTKEGAPSGADPKIGDLALYSPWGNLVVYYGDSKYANGIIIIGHIESGIEKLAKMDKKFKLTIERID